MAKTIVLCADDYGFNTPVSMAIRNLLATGRLTATSVMSTMPDWSQSAHSLVALKKQQKNNFDIGLHLNFTDGSGLTHRFKHKFPPLKYWLVRTHAHAANIRHLAQEMAAQLDQFCQVAGCMPDFIDGHQHVHQFPLFRRALVNLIAERQLEEKVWLRRTYPGCSEASTRIKQHIIMMTGARKFARICQNRKLRTNQAFAGITNFRTPYLYRPLMQHWLEECPDNTLIMCHPANSDDTNQDNIAQFRKIEYDYLASDEFVEDCIRYDVTIKPGSQAFQNH